MNAGIILTVAFVLQAELLEINYRVENNTTTNIYLTNHAVRLVSGEGPIPDRNHAFVWFEGGTVHIEKREPKPPTDRFYTPIPHYVTPVIAGTTYQESFHLPLPLKEITPYESTSIGKISRAERVDFTIGYILADATIEAARLHRAGQEVYLLRPNQSVIANPSRESRPVEEHTLKSRSQELAIPITLQTGIP